MAATIRVRIEHHFNYWRPILGLEGWNIVVVFDERKLKGYCITSPKYLEARIGFNLKRLRKILRGWRTAFPGLINSRDEYLEELVLHEMVHVVNPRSSETSISQTTYSLLRARNAGALRK